MQSWVSHFCCNTCETNLYQWLSKKRKSVPFVISMVWREPTDYSSNCYFCMILAVSKGISRKNKCTVKYPNIPSPVRPVPHGKELPIPAPPDFYILDPYDDHNDDWIQLALSHQRQLTLSLSYHIPLLNHTSYHKVNQMTWLEIFSYLRVKQSCLVQTKIVEPLRKGSQDVSFLWSQKESGSVLFDGRWTDLL